MYKLVITNDKDQKWITTGGTIDEVKTQVFMKIKGSSDFKVITKAELFEHDVLIDQGNHLIEMTDTGKLWLKGRSIRLLLESGIELSDKEQSELLF